MSYYMAATYTKAFPKWIFTLQLAPIMFSSQFQNFNSQENNPARFSNWNDTRDPDGIFLGANLVGREYEEEPIPFLLPASPMSISVRPYVAYFIEQILTSRDSI